MGSVKIKVVKKNLINSLKSLKIGIFIGLVVMVVT
jgi:hypothetical protein